MSNIQMDAHVNMTDRILAYLLFVVCLVGAITARQVFGERWPSQLATYAAFGSFGLALYAWVCGRRIKRYQRRNRELGSRCEARTIPATPRQDSTYVYKGEVVPLGEALGSRI